MASCEVVEEWLVRDVEAAGLVLRRDHPRYTQQAARVPADQLDPEERERRRVERRRVIENNKAWDAAVTVRREWVAQSLTRKTPPTGADSLIAQAVLAHPGALARWMQEGQLLLRDWLTGNPREHASYDTLISGAPAKRQTVLALGAVLAAWEHSLTRRSWHDPDRWDGVILQALIGWGYQASDVEQLMLPHPDLEADSEPAAA